jgi:uncharacterized SAM-binding protein YcdF (DUF218 family)
LFNIVADLLLPPASLAVVALLLLLGGRRSRRAALAVVVLLVVLGIPLVATELLNSLAPAPAEPGPAPGAIVILSGDAIRMQGTVDLEPGLLTLDRLRAGAALQRSTGLPILVTGGAFLDARTKLASMMATSLQEDFRVPVRWQEDRSADTWQNAEFSAAILRQAGISRVYLVTHFWHMRRAVLAFRDFGLDPVPAPVRPPYRPPFIWRELAMSTSAWLNSYFALHEWVGLAYYNLRR